jgi:UDP-glucuronate 4-epimerase
MQPGDVPRTYADTRQLEAAVGYKPVTPIEQGMQAFVEWFKRYRSI